MIFRRLCSICDMLSSFFSAYVESVALFIKYVSPVLAIFIGGICMFFGEGH